MVKPLVSSYCSVFIIRMSLNWQSLKQQQNNGLKIKDKCIIATGEMKKKTKRHLIRFSYSLQRLFTHLFLYFCINY